MFVIERVFHGVERYEVVEGERVTLFPAQLNELQQKLLELLSSTVAKTNASVIRRSEISKLLLGSYRQFLSPFSGCNKLGRGLQ